MEIPRYFLGPGLGRKEMTHFSYMMALQGTIILNSMKATNHVNLPIGIKVLTFTDKDFPTIIKVKTFGKNI